MHKLYVGVLFITLCILGCIVRAETTRAASQSVVISQVQVGNVASASNELIEIYNNSDTPIDITDWCLYYASASSLTSGSKLTCFTTGGLDIHVFLPARSYAVAISSQFATTNPTLGSDTRFSLALSGTAGHVRLLNKQNSEIDKLAWGQSAVMAEGNNPASVPTNTTLLQRKSLTAQTYQDTDNNNVDFQLAAPRATYTFGVLYEVVDVCSNIGGIQEVIPATYMLDPDGSCNPPPVDICHNLDGIQQILPSGYLFDEDNNCRKDVCSNMVGLQLSVPLGMDSNNGVCVPHDECMNLPGIQLLMPDNFSFSVDGECAFSILSPKITEIMPNVSGDDANHEYIEIYNPNAIPVNLEYFNLVVGKNLEKAFSFPSGTVINGHGYGVFYNNSIPFSLLNTSSRVGLALVDGTPMNEAEMYGSPGDDMAWSEVSGVWQYSDQPTPGEENQPSAIILDEQPAPSASLRPCAANQYRNPETNRCRSILLATSVLAACKDGQYRSEETNRCRSIAVATTLKACNDDQFRNPATGRCKKIASTDELASSDCGEGRERNPATNRCRNIATSSVPDAAFAIEPVKETGKAFIGWWVLGGVSLVAVGYAGWEWRHEISRSIRSLGSRFTSGK